MRKTYKSALQAVFQKRLCQDRQALGLTQEQMARNLSMTVRTYSDLERGTACCSAVSLMLYLLFVCTEPNRFLQELRQEIEGIRVVKTDMEED